MKKVSLFIVGLVAMLGFASSVSAADTATLKCVDKEIAPGESTTCTVSINTAAATTAAKVTLDVSAEISISNVKAGTGWTDMKAVAPTYSFEHTTGTTGLAELFSFTLTLSKDAAEKIDEENCGQLCIDTVTFNGGNATQLMQGSTGTCYLPTIIEKTPDPKNPETGAFANYAVIFGVAAVAVVSIIAARRSTKFYRV